MIGCARWSKIEAVTFADADSRSTRLERELAGLSADEMVSALGLPGLPAAVRAVLRAVFLGISAPLGRTLARFDARIGATGVAAAARAALEDLGAAWQLEGPTPPARGPLLVIANHPGAYDALVLLAAAGRDDLAIVAADRSFLRALPSLGRHLFFVDESAASVGRRARGLLRAHDHLTAGGAVLHFGAGRIEPDPAFTVGPGADVLLPWSPGTGALVRAGARCGGAVVVGLVSGVHSPRAKRLLLTRLAERRGITTLAPLLQVAIRRYRDVSATVRFTAAHDARALALGGRDATVTARVRALAVELVRRPDIPGTRSPLPTIVAHAR